MESDGFWHFLSDPWTALSLAPECFCRFLNCSSASGLSVFPNPHSSPDGGLHYRRMGLLLFAVWRSAGFCVRTGNITLPLEVARQESERVYAVQVQSRRLHKAQPHPTQMQTHT
ncbi:hypothetical protein JZ751_013969 [Albula glossodonta]|uniref:Uncharacterized protein n=1 Tax=Albula glossodonta TaxID=121402 RepID=A0A8T2MMV8_9TELE|nr:hypothetical protein JZ751_013969 [Albula glossodonta]